MARTQIGVLLLPLLLAGCIGGSVERAPSSLFTLAPAPAERQPARADATPLILLAPTVSQALAIDRIAVEIAPGRIAYLKDARWADQPARLFTDLLAETIAARGSHMVVDRRNAALVSGARLGGRLAAIGLDASAGEAVVVYDALLAPGGGEAPRAQRFEARVKVASERPEVVAQALGAAARQVAGEAADWVAAR